MEFKRLGQSIYQNMIHNTQEAKPYFEILGLVLVVSFTGFYIFNKIILPNGYESFALRSTIVISGLFLIFNQYWPKIFVKHSPWIFYLILFLSFPFFFAYMLFQNLDSHVWQINGLVGLVLLTFFVDWISFALMAIAGSAIAYIISIIYNPNIVLNSKLIGIYCSYSAPIIYFIIFSGKRQKLQEQKDLHNLQIKELNESLEQKVQERTHELKRALAAKTEFLNNMSHEIRTPVTGFLNISEDLVNHWDQLEDTKKFKYATDISKSANRLASLIGNLLDLAKLTSGKMILEIAQIDLKNAVNEMIEECNILYLTNKKIEIKFINKASNTIFAGDRERIAQVLRNLFYNSITFSSDDSVITATITNTKIQYDNGDNAKALHFLIEDEGIGIPEGEHELIFEAFVMSTRTKTRAGGTGLGLAIVKEIIEAHHGKIWAEDNKQKGAILHFIIPLDYDKKREGSKILSLDMSSDKESKNPPVDVENLSALPEISKTAQKEKTILIIDDDELIISSMELGFSASKYKLVGALGGAEGLEYLAKYGNKIDLILLDLMMPDIYGLNVLMQIKQNPNISHIPIILQSGASDLDEINKAYQLGIVDNIKKPYKAKDAIDKIGKIMQR